MRKFLAALLRTLGNLLLVVAIIAVVLHFMSEQTLPDEQLPAEWLDIDSPVVSQETTPEVSVEPYQPVVDESLLGEGFHGKLEGNDLVAFYLLKREVAKIASGERSSTKIEIPVSQLIGKTSFTAAELGVEQLADGNVIDLGARDAVRELLDIDFSSVIEVLLADCPFEMYWFDKTTPISISSGGSCTVSYQQSKGEYVLTIDGNPTVCLPVCAGYAAGEYQMVSPIPNRVLIADQTARGIVEAHAGESTYEKLAAYRAAVCDLATYDEVAGEDAEAFGDAWQLINVFDGDPSTNVVCEGYAKAFKYLCDLSDLPETECYLLEGTIAGGADGGTHMWNVLKMPDGNNYLVDVTNCDEGMAGTPDWLFLKGCLSGDPSAGYVFACARDSSVSYQYYDRMFGLYDDELLTLSSTDY